MYSNNFLANKVNICINRDNFLSHHNHLYIARTDHQSVKAYEVNLKFNLNQLISTMGEFFEREILINSNKINQQELPCFSLLDGKVKSVDTSKIVFKNKFVDSCGMASHFISQELVKTAFIEFFERQSFLLNYLSKSSGQKIIIERLNDVGIEENFILSDIYKHHEYLKQFAHDTEYYNISINSKVYVVLAISLSDTQKGIGLGTDICPYKAILKSQKEILQNFATYSSKYNYSDIGYYEDVPSPNDMYFYKFYHLEPENLKNLYSYLIKSEDVYLNDLISFQTIDLNKVINELSIEYGIEPFISMIPSKRDIPHLKIVKIFDFNWFPHMNAKEYDKHMFTYITEHTGIYLNEKESYIPFP